jgi:hypothetical protein
VPLVSTVICELVRSQGAVFTVWLRAEVTTSVAIVRESMTAEICGTTK